MVAQDDNIATKLARHGYRRAEEMFLFGPASGRAIEVNNTFRGNH